MNINKIMDLNGANLKSYPRLAIRLKKLLEENKISELKFRNTIDEDTYFKGLTLAIFPEYWNNQDTREINLYNEGTPEKTLWDYLGHLKGFTESYRLRTYQGNERKPITVEIDGLDVEIGCYLPSRNIIVIYYNLFGGTDLSKLFRNEVLFFFLDSVFNWMKENKVKKKDIKKMLEKKNIEKFSKAIKDEINQKASSNNEMESTNKDYDRGIINNLKKIQINEEVIKSLTKMSGKVKEFITKQMKEIKDLPFVKSVELDVNGIEIDIGEIFIRYSSRNIYIGDFTLKLLPDKIKIENRNPIKTEGGRTYHHPHIAGSSSGDICYGNRAKEVRKLLADNEFKKLVYFLYLYLKSYNGRDKYTSIQSWIDRQKELKEKRKDLEDVSDVNADDEEEEDD